MVVKFNINIAFRKSNSLGKHITNNKTNVDRIKKSGVHKFNSVPYLETHFRRTIRNFSQFRIDKFRKTY